MMKKAMKLFAAPLLLILINNKLVAQEKINFIPKSPEISSLGSFLDKNVNLSTGSVNVSLPLYELNVNENINIPIHLLYNTQGIKVNEMASSVGLGWNLSSTSSINRTINGKIDNYNDSSFNQNINLANQHFYTSSVYGNLNTPSDNWINNNVGLLDLEPDFYHVTLFGKSFSFTYDYSTQKFVQLPLDDYKIIPNINANGFIIDFIIIDNYGNKFFFGNSKDNMNYTAVIEELSNQFISNDNTPSDSPPPTINTWLLTKIETSENRTVRFYYENNYNNLPNDVNITSQYKYKFNRVYPKPGSLHGEEYLFNPDVPGLKVPIYPLTEEIFLHKNNITYSAYNITTIQDKVLSKIVYNDTEVIFNQNTTPRLDNDRFSLASIDLNIKNRPVKKWQLSYSYFNEEVQSKMPDNSRDNHNLFINTFDKYTLRLKLNNVIEKDYNLNDVKKYSFEYYPGELPSRLSFAQDYFGYYNGETSNNELIPKIYFKFENNSRDLAGTANRKVNEIYSKMGMLKTIIYPTKGSTEFTYENHRFNALFDSNEYDFTNLFENSLIRNVFSGGPTIINNPDGSISIPKLEQFEFHVDKVISADISCLISKVSNLNSYYLQLQKKVNGNTIHIMNFGSTYDVTNFTLYPGDYILVANRYTNTIDEGGTDDDFGDFSLNITYLDNSQDQFGNNNLAGGLRVKSILNKDNNGVAVLKTTFNYDETVNNNSFSTGILYGFPKIFVKDYYYKVNRFYGLMDFPFRNGTSSHILYSKVTQKEENLLNNSVLSTVHYFKNDFSPFIGNCTFEHCKTPYYSWKTALNDGKDILSGNSNSIVKKEKNVFSEKNAQYINFFSIAAEPRDQILTSNAGTYKTAYKYQVLPLYTDFTYLLNSKVLENFNSDTLETNNQYNYSSSMHYQPTSQVTTFPDSSTQQTTYSYAHEKNNQLMISKNMIGIPLETTVTQTVGGVTKTLGKTETVYPTALSTPQTGNLVLPLSEKSYDKLNNTMSTDVTYDKYDDKGNIVQYTEKDGTPVTIVWGYNRTEPIATIEDITYDQFTAAVSTNAIVSASNDDASDPSKEGLLLNALNDFRKLSALSGKKITTYTYDPLIGMTSKTSSQGVRQTFVYDAAGRLKEGNIRGKNNSGSYIQETSQKNNYKFKQ
ncbi:hypothetical protein [Chryseobacterium gambrini]|uniref:YD repeat-containing protein n=1 Tax=Chryseobacterium gambrini TaxID=373672 RepID=A0A1N7QZF7_9FLAO|nr:hypothetical protein [Chryseobacterium gambrini]SIT28261.1 YD repeat-containing protein [Chryseobacterium gambrini]